MSGREQIHIRKLPDGDCMKVVGRNAWALRNLVVAGERGCTPIDHPGPRWSGYVHRLRTRHGLVTETIHEQHGGPYAGEHARYVLRSDVEIVSSDDVLMGAVIETGKVGEAAAWLSLQPMLPSPIIPILQKRFGLSAKEAIEATREATLLRARAL